MVKLDKIYTRGGDSGLTSLGDGERVKKDSLRVETSYGEVDEIKFSYRGGQLLLFKSIKKDVKQIQNELFDIGAVLCMPKKKITTNQ